MLFNGVGLSKLVGTDGCVGFDAHAVSTEEEEFAAAVFCWCFLLLTWLESGCFPILLREIVLWQSLHLTEFFIFFVELKPFLKIIFF